MAHDVFISYATEDKETADRVCRALEDNGVGCWIAPRDIPPGRDYEEAIVEAIAASRVLVLILSAHSNASPHVKREVQHAFAENSPTRVIPFRIEPVAFSKALGYYLASVQWIDAPAPPSDEHLGRLARQVRAELAAETPTPTYVAGRDAHTPPPRVVDDGARRDPNPRSRALLWVALAAAALIAAVVGYFVLAPRGPRRNQQVNANVNPAAPSPTATPGRATPTPAVTPTPRPTFSPRPLPTRVIITNLNLNRAPTRAPNVNRTP